MIVSTGCGGMGLNIGGFWLVSQSDIILQTWMIHSTAKIMSFYTASEYKYPAYIYNTPLNQRPEKQVSAECKALQGRRWHRYAWKRASSD